MYFYIRYIEQSQNIKNQRILLKYFISVANMNFTIIYVLWHTHCFIYYHQADISVQIFLYLAQNIILIRKTLEEMNTDPKKNKELMGNVYKQFSKIKYNKYKHQFPRMRESDIINKIIKEWQKLSQKEKDELLEQYSKSNQISEEISESDSSKQRRQMSLSARKSRNVKKGGNEAKIQSVRVKHESSKEQSPKQSSGKKKKSGSKKSGSKKSDKQYSSSERSIFKTKIIKKGGKDLSSLPNSEYLQFFSYYYERLTQQHPKWTATQTSTIIKLLWKKRNKSIRDQKRGKKKDKKYGVGAALKKSISGRMAFKKAKLAQGFNRDDIYPMWKKLPRESKITWEKSGRGWMKQYKKRAEQMMRLKGLFKQGAEQAKENIVSNLSFMRKTIS